eukprot:CAMPEP_0195603100 /NCGR_PEP_ID=MMETSP0815-20121206/5948_1 /TAXON_ID=97485 /ORGANISM="Prymnesium parvum, Strain Texoma1" /LENGTH=121 /DNA_ID=CAMNT_0040742705 /DNA_START=451 /DNA_END=817 /DNA_ORIENTATION=+
MPPMSASSTQCLTRGLQVRDVAVSNPHALDPPHILLEARALRIEHLRGGPVQQYRVEPRKDARVSQVRKRVYKIEGSLAPDVPLEALGGPSVHPEDALVRVDGLAILAIQQTPCIGDERTA